MINDTVKMTRTISSDDMSSIRRSLAQAGIYFDKLYISQVLPLIYNSFDKYVFRSFQAFFNSNFTIQALDKKRKGSSKSFWQKLLCGSSKVFFTIIL